MWIQVRLISGSDAVRIDNLSKLTKIEDLRKRLVDHFNAEEGTQRLFYRGKQMEDGYTLYDYDVNVNDTVQLLIRKNMPAPPPVVEKKEDAMESDHEVGDNSDKENTEPKAAADTDVKTTPMESEDTEASLYKVGDIIDARDYTVGAWFEAKILKVEIGLTADMKERIRNTSAYGKVATAYLDGKQEKDDEETGKSTEGTQTLDFTNPDGFSYEICFEKYPDDVLKVMSIEIRPRARTLVDFSKVEVGQHIMANYNYEESKSRGFWYDCIVTGKKESRTVKELLATVFIGSDLMPLNNSKIIFTKELFAIEAPGTQIREDSLAGDASTSIGPRESKPECEHCNDIPRRNCKHCSCVKCGDKKDPEKSILCDECNKAYHLYCLDPPLETVPDEDDWYCPECKNDDSTIVKTGEGLKHNKKKAKMASAKSTSNRDWGKGMACVGRSKVCTVVSSNHFGPIPGVEVGTLWKFRVQVSEAGVHRPHVAGIHGREEDGAFSIVLSGGYEDDADDGEEFYYTGSGGRDLSGNKRTAEQSCDQTLTRMNKALAKNCNAPIDAKKGGEAKDWQAGKPVRVVRNCKGRKHSQYAPEEGNRYDGVYKIVKYWPEKGKSGFLVWRYLLRRDDPIAAPWTKAGKKRTGQLGLEMQYPDGYLESQAEKEKAKESEETPGKKKGRKRKSEACNDESVSTPKQESKKAKIVQFTLEDDTLKLIKEDEVNKKLWDEALRFTTQGSKVFYEKVEELFLCICCQEIVCKPLTLECNHNICKSCLSRSFKADVYSCPACRAELDKGMSLASNKSLTQALNKLFPGYENGR